MGAVFEILPAEDLGGQPLQLHRVGDIAGLDGGLAGDRMQGLVPEPLRGVQPAVLQMARNLGQGGRRVGGADLRRDLPQQQVSPADVVQIVAEVQQRLPVLQKQGGLLPVQAAGQGRQQGLAHHGVPLGPKPFKVDPLVGRVLVDEDQLLPLLHQDIGAEDLADVAEVRPGLRPVQRNGGRLGGSRRLLRSGAVFLPRSRLRRGLGRAGGIEGGRRSGGGLRDGDFLVHRQLPGRVEGGQALHLLQKGPAGFRLGTLLQRLGHLLVLPAGHGVDRLGGLAGRLSGGAILLRGHGFEEAVVGRGSGSIRPFIRPCGFPCCLLPAACCLGRALTERPYGLFYSLFPVPSSL